MWRNAVILEARSPNTRGSMTARREGTILFPAVGWIVRGQPGALQRRSPTDRTAVSPEYHQISDRPVVTPSADSMP